VDASQRALLQPLQRARSAAAAAAAAGAHGHRTRCAQRARARAAMGLTASRESSALLGAVLLCAAVWLGLALASSFARMQLLAGPGGFGNGNGDGLLSRLLLALCCAGDEGGDGDEEDAARVRTPLVRPLTSSTGHLADYGVNVSRVQATTRADLAYKAPKAEEQPLDHPGY
jgi:hypothetical protein